MSKNACNVSSSQYRRYTGVSYLSRDILLSILRNKNAIAYYAFILHDKDIVLNQDGTESLKPPHFHLILLLKYPQKKLTVSNWFKGWEDENGSINTFLEPMSDLNSCFRYFRHLDHPDKYQYPLCDIYSNDLIYITNLLDNDNDYTEDKLYIGLEMYMNGDNPRNIAYKLGRDFIIHYRAIKELADDIYHYEYRQEILENKKKCEEAFKLKHLDKQ